MNLTNHPEDDMGPSWSPDAAKIAFASGRPDLEIYVMNADGTNQINVTSHPGPDFDPDWR